MKARDTHLAWSPIDGMPMNQVNAHLEDGLTMRVGIPEKSGQLVGHAFDRGYPVMVSASAFWQPTKGRFIVPNATDLWDLDVALDSAGFVAMNLWARKGRQAGLAGIYPWTIGQYTELASEIGCQWWSQPDLACEPEIASSREEVDYRVRATATLLEATLACVYEWQSELAKECPARVVASLIKPPIPILQGYRLTDYLKSMELMQAVWERWQPWVDAPRLIGVGSVCRRGLHDPEHGLISILNGLEAHVPSGSRLHLYGVKGQAIKDICTRSVVASTDSMAWDFGARMKALRAQRSNTIVHRCEEMDRWMRAAAERVLPRVEAGFRLPMAA